MAVRQTVEPEAPGSNQAAGEFFRAMQQRVTSYRVHKIHVKWTYDRISVHTAR